MILKLKLVSVFRILSYLGHGMILINTQHICAFYSVVICSGNLESHPLQFSGQDSNRAKWVELNDLNIQNLSLLVLKIVDYMTKNHFNPQSIYYKEWTVYV
ncbi:NUDIX hydrolase [Bacillus changyiensis]|uniref:hypothetical protein n=1 Tax=Bacillus changyiensis TaxID=3004103 RepID=UPI0022E90314|nr:hypothetical protein [Bacillus changyiensis]MDA1477353.1 hypothetical protein [Bacillus changyiensis]